MNNDKRTVTTDALETLGSIITPNEKRDAIHLAVENVVAAHDLRAGENVGFIGSEVGKCADPVGIVDPFLKRPVQKGERFWLVVYPRQITSLRHVWTHPAFPESEVETVAAVPVEADSAAVSRQWIEKYAASIPLAYETLMGGADEWVSSKADGGWGEYLCFGGLLEGEYVPDEFWPHYETVRGEVVPEDQRGSFFTCSC